MKTFYISFELSTTNKAGYLVLRLLFHYFLYRENERGKNNSDGYFFGGKGKLRLTRGDSLSWLGSGSDGGINSVCVG